MRRQQESHFRNADQLTLPSAMQMANCKNFVFRRDELNSSTRPQVSKFKYTVPICGPVDLQVVHRLERNRMEKKDKKTSNADKSNKKTRKSSLSKKRKPFLDKRSTPREVKRMLNSKAATFQQWETYPSVPLTPVLKKVSVLNDSSVENRPGRPFDMDQDDIVEVWRRSPNKDTLGYYGVGTGTYRPEAIVFNQVIEKCLKKVKPPEVKGESEKTPAGLSKPMTMHQSFIVNREQMKSKVDKMACLKVIKAISWLHCPRSFESVQPFFQSETQIGQKHAVSEKRSPKTSHSRRRQKQQKGELQHFECAEEKHEPTPYEIAFQKEMEKLEKKNQSEPLKYDELISKVLTCFQQKSYKDSGYEAFKSCKATSQHGFYPDFNGHSDIGGGDSAPGCAPTQEIALRDGLARAGESVEFNGGVYKFRYPDPKSDDSKSSHKSKSRGAGDGIGSSSSISSCDVDGLDKGLSKSSSTHKKFKAQSKFDGKKTTEKPRRVQPSSERSFDWTYCNQQPNYPFSSPYGFVSDDLCSSNSRDSKSDEAERSSSKRGKINKQKSAKTNRRCIPHISRYIPNDKYSKTIPNRDCFCEVCELMQRRDREPYSPLVNQLKEEEKLHNLRHCKGMCHKEQLTFRKKDYHSSQYECEPVKVSNCFCTSRKWGEYLDRLDALQELQRLFGHMDNELLCKVKALKDRLCWQICEGLQIQRKLMAIRH